MNTDPSHDAWLREALRHAPDAEITPPPALRETILRQARATVAPARPGTRVANRWWDWFTRPVVASGFAGLMVSVLLVLIWRSGEFEDEAVQIQPSAQAPAAPVQEASEPAVAADASSMRTPEAAAVAKAEKPALAKRSVRQARPAAVPPAAPPAAPPAERRADTAAAGQAPRSRDEALRREAAPATAATLAAVDPLPPVVSGAALRWSLASRSHRHDLAQQAWFDRLRVATAGRWQRAGDTAHDGLRIQLFDGTEPRGDFVLARDHVLWLDPTRGAWRAPLAEADAAQLESLAKQW